MDTRSCVIAALSIDSVAQPNGVYTASGHDWMGGGGRLYVGVPEPPAGAVLVVK